MPEEAKRIGEIFERLEPAAKDFIATCLEAGAGKGGYKRARELYEGDVMFYDKEDIQELIKLIRSI